MLRVSKNLLSSLGVDTSSLYQTLSARSIAAALREQDLGSLVADLREVVPDVSDQYTDSFANEDYRRYWELKIRGQQAFQIRSVLDTLTRIDGGDLSVVDIGDSSGNHAAYIQALAPQGKVKEIISANLDPVAVQKIKDKGGKAYLCRAEDLGELDINPDLLLCFETLEHLIDPVGFLRRLACSDSAEHLLLTVPYRRDSRFGGYHLRAVDQGGSETLSPEKVHIHEYCLEDWLLLAHFSGWRSLFAEIYLQYPRRSIYRLSAPLWRKLDFEGYVGILLKRDLRFSDQYTGW